MGRKSDTTKIRLMPVITADLNGLEVACGTRVEELANNWALAKRPGLNQSLLLGDPRHGHATRGPGNDKKDEIPIRCRLLAGFNCKIGARRNKERR